jgi:hypothetical protein
VGKNVVVVVSFELVSRLGDLAVCMGCMAVLFGSGLHIRHVRPAF